LTRFRPEVILVTGGYVCVAVTLAAWLERVPVLIYLPDIEPGLAIRFLSRLAARVAVTCEESVRFFPPHKVVVTGYPVRSELSGLNRAKAKQALHLDSDSKTLLVFGGSRGARSINQALVAGLPRLLEACQVVHVSGRRTRTRLQKTTEGPPERARHAITTTRTCNDMPQALVAADLAVARAGAATLGEFPAAGLPAVLVPYPYSGRHQDANADYLARHGAARIMSDAQLSEQLVPAVLALLDDETTLATMRRASESLARPDAARSITRQLQYLARESGTREAGTKP
jgi:UDP-N-acetylglucosamine--N-acetylmuramyl-(pentapeptide) pyrophosphoryl-undecaprenol N-acetylglucosamine transferase